MVLPGLEAYLAKAEANLRRLEAEDALLQSPAARQGLPPSSQSVACVHDPQEPVCVHEPQEPLRALPQCIPTLCDEEDVEPDDSDGSENDAGAQARPSLSLSSQIDPDPRLINKWRKGYVAIHRLLRERSHKTWTRREIVRLLTSPCEGEETLAFGELPISRATEWRTKTRPGTSHHMTVASLVGWSRP